MRRHLHLYSRFGRFLCILGIVMGWIPNSSFAGHMETGSDGRLHLHLTIFDLPDPSRTDPVTRAEIAVQREFLRQFPQQIAARAQANPQRYAKHPFHPEQPPVLHLHRFSGIRVEGVENTLLAIAGNVAPDVLSVNFRQSDTYIQQGFLYPLDLAEDAYATAFSPEEYTRRIHPKIRPVLERSGPDGQTHLWAIPSGSPLGRVVLYRKDLFDEAGLTYPSNSWTWNDFLTTCRTLADPARGIYALGLSRGKHESYLWMPFLWGAGGEVLRQNPATGEWEAAFDTPAAAQALDFYIRLTTEPWTDRNGRSRRGYVIKDTTESNQKWKRGQLGMVFAYMDNQLLTTLNPDLTGIVALPIGPEGRGTEINSRMMGIFAGTTDPLLRDAAWEYIQYQYSQEAEAIRTRILVEGGLGRFLPPDQLKAAGYPQLAAISPPGWADTFHLILNEAQPEPYGKNAAAIYDILTTPIREAEQLSHTGQLPDDESSRLALLQTLLARARQKVDSELLQQIPPDRMRERRIAAIFLLGLLVLVATAAIRQTIRTFRPALQPTVFHTMENRRKTFPYRGKLLIITLLLAPALLTILIWHYIPLVRGSLMAFYDYHIWGSSLFVGLDNFANLLWDADWWRALATSARYSLLVITLTFLPPLFLAVLLQEVPRGKILFRLIFYLPATMSGLVVILLWKTWMEPSEAGLLNRLTLHIPAIGWFILGLLPILLCLHLARRLRTHQRYRIAWLLAGIGLFLAWSPLHIMWKTLQAAPAGWMLPSAWFAMLPEPVRWLDDPNIALFSCVLPMLWAGMGPGCLIYLAALKGIPDDLYEAADMDGATFTDKILFIVIPTLRPLLLINFVGVFIASWQAEANILAMTAGGAGTEVAGLHIFYKAFIYLRFGPATAAAWMLACLLIGFTIYQLRILSRVEFRAHNPESGITT